jgi:hypothetical protein
MKQKITLLVLAAVCVFGMNAQVIFTQNFNSYSSVISASSNWTVVNNSSPLGITSWFMGNPNFFQAYTGPDSTYFAANYNNTAGSTGTISNWLITPTVNLTNGGVLQFATRTATTQTPAPDRLEVYLSTAGTGSNVGNTSTSLGTFSTQVTTVNAGLTANGYPAVWTVITTTLSGITGTVSGRFGFRYFVTSAGPQGTNGNYIGLDEIKYTLPCASPTISINTSTTEICSGNVVTLTGNGANTYTWSNGQTGTTTVVSPVATTVYTLMGSSVPGCNSTETVAITVTVTPSISVNNVTTCPGTAATLVASGASSYSWSTGATTNSIVVTPTTSTNYIVTGYNGVCEIPKYVSVTLGTSLSVVASASQPTNCSARTMTLMGSGALTYTWKPGTNLTGQSVTVAPTATGTTIYTLTAASGSCAGISTVSVQVLPLPTQTITASAGPFTLAASGNITLCPLTVVNFTANSASAASYSWVGAGGPGSVYTATLPTTSGTVTVPATFSAIVTGTNGCTRTSTVNVTVRSCSEVGIESKELNAGAVSVFPNPFGNELKITGLSGRVEVYSALGQLVFRQALTDRSETLNTESLAKGVYILKLYNAEDKLMSTQKVIRN